MMRCLTLLIAVLCLGVIPQSSLHAQSPSDYQSNVKFQAAIAEGKQWKHKRQLLSALDSYKKASKIADNKDAACLREIYDLQIGMGSYKDAVNTASMLITVVTTSVEKSSAESNRGYALLLQAGDKNKADLLKEADYSLKAAIADNPKNATALYIDGQVLARLGQQDAARDQFKACLSCVNPKDPSYVRVQHFAANPELALQKMVPSFTITALDGSKFNLDAMNGRVVLIDFWATWCGPCKRELPNLKKIAKEFAGEPLVMISVSWDSDEAKWKEFIQKNEMTWVQYRDADHRLGTVFDINAIPHYFIIDSDGVLTSEMIGDGHDVEGKLKKLIAKAKVAAAASTTAVGN
jgi:thiol-disulfide isomerase/thioredoxin